MRWLRVLTGRRLAVRVGRSSSEKGVHGLPYPGIRIEAERTASPELGAEPWTAGHRNRGESMYVGGLVGLILVILLVLLLLKLLGVW
jgi:hypothetical protein